MSDSHDNLFKNDVEKGSFEFNQKISEVFHDMASRSIPHYFDIQKFIVEYVLEIVQNKTDKKTSILDIGCSVGYTAASIFENLLPSHNDVKICVSDISEHMMTKCKQNLSSYGDAVSYICCDLTKADERTLLLHESAKNSSELKIIICNFVLQFLPMATRKTVLGDFWQSLSSGGMMLIGEKVRSTNTDIQKVWTKMHHDYKLKNNYSEKQIHEKQKALEGVLQESSHKELLDLFYDLPHAHIEQFFSWGAFHCFVLQKGEN